MHSPVPPSLLLSVLLVVAACGPVQTPPPLPVWYGGCAYVDAAERCLGAFPLEAVPEEGALSLWVPRSEPELLEVTPPSVQVTTRRAVDGGVHLALALPVGTEEVRVSHVETGAVWSLQLRPWPRVLVDAVDHEGVEDRLAAVDAAPRPEDAYEAALVDVTTGSWAWRGEDPVALGAEERLREGIAAFEAGGHLRDAATAQQVLAYQLEHRQGAVPAAPPDLPPLDEARGLDAKFVFNTAWTQERYHRWTGAYREAWADLETMERLDRQVFGRSLDTYYLGRRAEALELLGDHEGAIGLHREALATAQRTHRPAEEQVQLSYNLGLAMQIARERGAWVGDAAQIRALLSLALQSDDAPVAAEEAHLDLARVALTDGDLDACGEHLALARDQAEGGRLVAQQEYHRVLARLRLAEGDVPGALEAAAAGLQVGVAWGQPLAELDLHLVRAEALEAGGRRQEALQAYEAQQSGWMSQGALVPIQHGRSGFLSRVSRAVAAHAELLLEEGQAPAALELTRRARFQLLANLYAVVDADTAADTATWPVVRQSLTESLEQRATLHRQLALAPRDQQVDLRAALSSLDAQIHDALEEALGERSAYVDTRRRPPLAGETFLTWMERPDGPAWMAQSSAGTSVHRGAAEQVLAAVIRRHGPKRLLVLPSPSDEHHPLHLTAVDGQPLVASVPVAWSLDLPEVVQREVPRTALVVADPRGDLRDARREAEAVVPLLEAAGWQVTTLIGPQATRAAVLSALPGVGLLHYAGHGSFDGDVLAPWESSLWLADGDRLTLRDVLALAEVPPWVVLSGCDTARSSDLDVTDLGLAQAFLARGALAVLGTTEEVDSQVALQVARVFHQRLVDEGEPVAAFSHTMAELSGEADAGALATFRVLVP